jgi:hypothetical protein
LPRRWTLVTALILAVSVGPVSVGAVAPAAAQPSTFEDETTLQAPEAFLGYELGTAFTPHHRVMDYVRHVATASPNAALERYGTTPEGRPLVVAYVTAPGNLDRLEAIRQDNLRRAGMLNADGAASRADAGAGDGKAIVWLSYNVHGNESVSTETAMRTLYALADPDNERTQAWLDDTVVILDPCLNPDGRARYVQWYKRTAGTTPNARIEAREHQEPWPSGRTNHYYFDLNRDWAWAVQPETRQRLPLYHRWMPHVHVDFHEQGINDPYYFAPGAEPFHENITDWQRTFQFTIGRNHADYFDQNHWLYFTREVFDLFYPGYGDTWPLFNGAIGMTYEQAGSGRAGLAVETADGDTLTLRERIAHHHTTGLSTVEVAAENRDALLSNFADYYDTATSDPPGDYAAYIVKAAGGAEDTRTRADRLQALAAQLDRQGIRYARAGAEQSARGVRYADGAETDFTVAPGDLVVPAAQPKARLAKVLMEPRPTLRDSLTYDITAWALPYAYGLEAYAATSAVDTSRAFAAEAPAPPDTASTPYAYVTEWSSAEDVQLLARLLAEDVTVRFATEPFRIGERRYGRGTLVIPRAGNRALGGRLDRIVYRLADSLRQPVQAVRSGFIEEGPDFGSDNYALAPAPEVAVLSGSSLSPSAVGEAWYYFDRQIRYPATMLKTDDLSARVLQDYDVLVMPGGRYGDVLDEETQEALQAWIENGGRLVALGRAVGALAGREGFAIQQARPDSAAVAESESTDYGDAERTQATEAVPGSVHPVTADTTHPLAFGLRSPYFTLKRGASAFAPLEDGWSVGTLDGGAPVSGFAGAKAQKQLANTLVFGVQDRGAGAVVYLVDNPLFRGFWYSGRVLFGNAVFLVGND